jgi:4-diphosphocytidyl-2-C-methyl-D-erythritol kinase
MGPSRRRAPTASGEVSGPAVAPYEPRTLLAQAKVNLTLEVLRRREDGFHEIKSVMQRITLADKIILEPAGDLILTCNRPELEGPDNLVWRAALLLREETGSSAGARIHLVKRIPVAAGLGGGSADGAMALAGLNAFWDLRLSQEQLRELAARLGSDVPFFLADGPIALAEGRGEKLTPLPGLRGLPAPHLVLVKPPVGISAGAVYKAFPRERWSDGTATDRWMDAARDTGTVPAPFNALEPVALDVEPRAALAKDALLNAGAPHPVMAGSGSTYFALFDTAVAAEAVARRVPTSDGNEVHLARLVTV